MRAMKMRWKLHPLFLAYGAVCIFFGRGWSFAAYVVAVVLHEYAHMLAARSRGVPTDVITLYPFGGEIKLNYINIPTWDEIRIALAGPIANLLLATVFLAAWWLFPGCYGVTLPFYEANLSTGLCNLIPVYPLDGGRVLVSLLKQKLTKYKAIMIAKISGYVLAAAVLGIGIFAAITAMNFSFIGISFFLLFGLADIKARAYTNSYLDSRKRALLKKNGLKECLIMVDENALLYELVTMSNRDFYYVFDVVDANYRRVSRLDESKLYDLAAKYDIYTPIGTLVSRQFS